MSLVRFACICDYCGARSEEYTAWPSCEECMKDACFECMRIVHESTEGKLSGVCKKCFLQQLLERVELMSNTEIKEYLLEIREK